MANCLSGSSIHLSSVLLALAIMIGDWHTDAWFRCQPGFKHGLYLEFGVPSLFFLGFSSHFPAVVLDPNLAFWFFNPGIQWVFYYIFNHPSWYRLWRSLRVDALKKMENLPSSDPFFQVVIPLLNLLPTSFPSFPSSSCSPFFPLQRTSVVVFIITQHVWLLSEEDQSSRSLLDHYWKWNAYNWYLSTNYILFRMKREVCP